MLEHSESNIYDEPKETKSEEKKKTKRYKTIYHVMDQGFDYQEVNEDGKSIGEILSHIPKESEQASGILSKRSMSEQAVSQEDISERNTSAKQINLKANLVVIAEE